MRKIITAALALLAGLQLMVAVPAFAGTAPSNDPLSNLNQTNLSSNTVEQNANALPIMIGKFIRIALGLLGIIFVILMVYAGFTWMTAAGDTKKVETAQGTIKRAIMGVIIVILAYAITSFVLNSLLRAATLNAT